MTILQKPDLVKKGFFFPPGCTSLMTQFYAGFDTPLQSSVVSPEGAPKPGLRTVGLGSIRVVSDWRYSL